MFDVFKTPEFKKALRFYLEEVKNNRKQYKKHEKHIQIKKTYIRQTKKQIKTIKTKEKT